MSGRPRTGSPVDHDHSAGDDHPHFHAHDELPRHGGRYDSILDAIGHTPLVEIPRMSPNPAVRLYAKLEMTNPTGSVKDRAAKYLVEDLERRELLAPDSVILEPTSGNTGIALAMIGRRKGYRVALVMPANVTEERRQVAALYGAEIIDSPAELGSNGAIALARHLAARDPRFVMPDQYGNPANPRAHYETTGPEILADCPEVDVFVAGLGTSGTLMGVGRFLREAKPGVRVFAAEPLPGENVQGLRSLDEGFVPEIFEPDLLDGKYLVSNRDAVAALRDLVFREGIFAGPSCGAVLVAAARIASGHGARDDRRAPARRRLEVPLRGHVQPRPRGDGRRLRGRRQLVVSAPRDEDPAAGPVAAPAEGRAAGPSSGSHPGPERAVLPAAIRAALVAHARAGYPDEACGLIAGTAPAAAGGTPTTWHPARNRAASPLRYEIHPEDLLRISLAVDDADEVIWGIVHSHVRSPARPSPTDVGLALYPDALYILVSLSEAEADPATGAESVRAWRILDGVVFEVVLEPG